MVAAPVQRLIDLLYPERCVVCSRFGRSLCAPCEASLAPCVPGPRCANCSARWEGSGNCPRCFGWDALDGALAAVDMEGAVRRIVHGLKYRYVDSLAAPMAARLQPLRETRPFDVAYAVPLHRSRQRKRGFNQAEVLLGHLGWPPGPGTLERVRKTSTQVGLRLRERRSNVGGAFRYRGAELTGRTVALVDDVVTTGATANECARVLKDFGARSVHIIAFARSREQSANRGLRRVAAADRLLVPDALITPFLPRRTIGRTRPGTRRDSAVGAPMTLAGARPLSPQAAAAADVLARVRAQIHRVIVGQDLLIDRLLIGLLCEGHVLVEGVPGLAKSLAVSTLARTLHLEYVRIQFTPDLLPADLVGTEIFSPSDGRFTVRRGPLFANVVLADEVNRAPAKVQSALLEAMQERHITIGGQTFPLDEPFLVMATQNPIEQEGTYPLPEAQLDRFLLKVRVGYPTRQEERQIMELGLGAGVPMPDAVATHDDIFNARQAVHDVALDDSLKEYIVQVVHATRRPAAYQLPALEHLIAFGASPRATIALAQAARAHAFLQGRAYTTPDDIKALAHDVLRHRIVTTYEAEAEELTSDDLIDRVLESVAIP